MQIHKNSLRGNFNAYNRMEREWERTSEWSRMLANPSDENKDSVKNFFFFLLSFQLIEKIYFYIFFFLFFEEYTERT